MTRESAFRRRLLVAVDAVSYGQGNDQRHTTFQSALVAVLRAAAAAAGLCWDQWTWERAGDGGLALLPPEQAEPLVVDDFVRELRRELAQRNGELEPPDRLRLRMAIHFGTAIPADNGWAGQGVVVVSRLVDALPIRCALAEADESDLAVILSSQTFDDVVRQGHVSLHASDFRRVSVQAKEYSAEAWLRVPGLRPDELVVDPAGTTTGGAAGDHLGPHQEAGVPRGDRDAGAHPPAAAVTSHFYGPVHADGAVFGPFFGDAGGRAHGG